MAHMLRKGARPPTHFRTEGGHRLSVIPEFEPGLLQSQCLGGGGGCVGLNCTVALGIGVGVESEKALTAAFTEGGLAVVSAAEGLVQPSPGPSAKGWPITSKVSTSPLMRYSACSRERSLQAKRFL
eukprot:RCo009772